MGDFGDMAASLRDMADELDDGFDNDTESTMEKSQEKAKFRLVQNDNIARGRAGGVLAQIETIPLDNGWQVVAPKPTTFIEFGTGPRGEGRHKAPDPMPPLQPILNWIIEKGIVPTEYDSVYGLAVAIQETIGQFGTQNYPFMRPTWWGYTKPTLKRSWRSTMTSELHSL